MQDKTRIKHRYLEEFCKWHQRHLCAIKGGQPPHRGLIAEKCIFPPSEEIFSSNFQH